MLSAERLPITTPLPAHAETAIHEIEADVTFLRLVLDEPAQRADAARLDLVNLVTERLERGLLALRAALGAEVCHE